MRLNSANSAWPVPIRCRLARQERLEAGFTVEELEEIEQPTSELAGKRGQGPRRQTLQDAAEILRDRHQARRRGEDVPPIVAQPQATA